jgi:hypothetical protein
MAIGQKYYKDAADRGRLPSEFFEMCSRIQLLLYTSLARFTHACDVLTVEENRVIVTPPVGEPLQGRFYGLRTSPIATETLI